MISNTKDIWRLESKWSDHDRFWKDHDRKLAGVSYDFFLNFTCAHKHKSSAVIQKITGKHGKLKEFAEKHGNLCGGERYRSESCLHRAYRYILKTKQLRAKVLKHGPCKQAVRSYWMYVF